MSIASRAVIAGFAIFSMLFGSGNIVFPVMLGRDFTDHFIYVILGWLCTAVIIPISGYFGSMLYDSDNKKYLAPLGKYVSFLLMLTIMVLAGPFAIIPRNVMVSFGSIHVLSPGITMWIFNSLYCAVMVMIAWNPGKLVQIMGAIFTPLKLGGVSLIAVAALYFGSEFSALPHCNTPVNDVFIESFKAGYQTLDLMASFIMSSVIFIFLKGSLSPEKQNDRKYMMKFAGSACLIGALALGAVYACLVLIGAQYSVHLTDIPKESLFPKIAELALGSYAAWFIAIVIVACCLATNVALSSVFTDFVHRDILKQRFDRNAILVIVGLITFAMSLIGFDTIFAIMAKILSAIYPVLIIFTFARMAHYFARVYNKR